MKPAPIQRAYVAQRKAFERDNANQEFYNSWKWRKLAKAYKVKYPLCVMCNANGYVTAVRVVDHIVRINAGGAPYDDANLQSLCEKCHNSKSAKEARGMGYKSL